MPESENTAAPSTWNTPECPFTIEYSPRALDDIRLAVVDAFFSLPRGGAEIGGILLGTWDGKRLAIADYAALDCEHAFGPSFTLSPRDEARLTELLAAPVENGLRPAGWYHSHTRSEIFLSDADREIHRRFFPEPWQVALVLKPHTFQPTRAGFFFRGADGGIHAEASYNEFVLAPRMVKPAPASAPLAAAQTPRPAPAPAAAAVAVPEPAPVLHSAPPEPPPVPAIEPEAPIEATPLPKFLDSPPSRSKTRLRVKLRRPGSEDDDEEAPPRSRRWLKVAIALLAGFALGAAAYLKRDILLPPLWAMVRQHIPAPPPPVGLNTIDREGQLQIRWDRNSPDVQRASNGVLSIDSGGASKQEIPMDKAHLLSGIVTVARQGEQVDVSLTLTRPDGRSEHELATFVGKLPERKPAEDAAAKEQRENLAKQVAKIQTDLDAEIEQNAKLKKSVDQLSKRLIDQQRSRLLNQVGK